MKKILFDLTVCQPYGSSKFHGGGVYGFVVFKALADTFASDLIAYYDDRRYLAPDILSIIKEKGIATRKASETSLVSLYEDKEYERIYSPLWDDKVYPALATDKIPLIVTEHGLRYLEMITDTYEPLYARGAKEILKSWLKQIGPVRKRLLNKKLGDYGKIFSYPGVKVITVSNHSKASICHFFPSVKSDDVKVFYSPNTSDGTLADAPSPVGGKYYLMVSADRWIKNSYRAIRSLDRLFSSHPEIEGKVVLTGIDPTSWLMKIRLENKDRFVPVGYLDRAELEALYREAYALVYPSLNEGFGYPPVEAMKYGVPVIASSFASLSEILGDAPLYVNPYSGDEIATRVIQLEDPSLHRLKRQQSLARYEYIHQRQNADLAALVEYIMA